MVLTHLDYDGAQIGDTFSVPGSWVIAGSGVVFVNEEMIIGYNQNAISQTYVTQTFASTIGDKIQVKLTVDSALSAEVYVTENLIAPPGIIIASDLSVISGQGDEIIIQFTASQTSFAVMITASVNAAAVFSDFIVNQSNEKVLTDNAQQFIDKDVSVSDMRRSVDGTQLYVNFTREEEEVQVTTGYISAPIDIQWDEFFDLVSDYREFTYDDLSLSPGFPVNPIQVRMKGDEQKNFIGPTEDKVTYDFSLIKT